METMRFLLTGLGGQGIITMAILLGEAAVLYEGLNAVQTQAYGPEARGGATQSDVVITDHPIYFPKATQPNILVALTNETAAKHLPLIRPGGILVYDTDLVKPARNADAIRKGLPMREATLDTFGSTVPFNMTVLGALVTITGVVALASVEKAAAAKFSEQYQERNAKALHLGASLARKLTEAV